MFLRENRYRTIKIVYFLEQKEHKSRSRLPLFPCYKPTLKGLRALAHDLIPMRSRETSYLPEPIAAPIALRAHV